MGHGDPDRPGIPVGFGQGEVGMPVGLGKREKPVNDPGDLSVNRGDPADLESLFS